jgi:hypothetical protein
MGESGMSVHNFDESLRLSHAQGEEGHWRAVYQQFFTNFHQMVDMRHDGEHQRRGIDRIVILANGQKVNIEEKYSTYKYPTILLERWSNQAAKKPGWAQKELEADWLAYAQLPNAKTFMLPWRAVRKAWLTNGKSWLEEYNVIEARNQGYVTECIAVPDQVLLRAVASCMEVPWVSHSLTLAQPSQLQLPT